MENLHLQLQSYCCGLAYTGGLIKSTAEKIRNASRILYNPVSAHIAAKIQNSSVLTNQKSKLSAKTLCLSELRGVEFV